jgi:hypothetical protein
MPTPSRCTYSGGIATSYRLGPYGSYWQGPYGSYWQGPYGSYWQGSVRFIPSSSTSLSGLSPRVRQRSLVLAGADRPFSGSLAVSSADELDRRVWLSRLPRRPCRLHGRPSRRIVAGNVKLDRTTAPSPKTSAHGLQHPISNHVRYSVGPTFPCWCWWICKPGLSSLRNAEPVSGLVDIRMALLLTPVAAQLPD